MKYLYIRIFSVYSNCLKESTCPWSDFNLKYFFYRYLDVSISNEKNVRKQQRIMIVNAILDGDVKNVDHVLKFVQSNLTKIIELYVETHKFIIFIRRINFNHVFFLSCYTDYINIKFLTYFFRFTRIYQIKKIDKCNII